MLEFDKLVETEGLEALRAHFPWIGPFDLSKVVAVEHKADGSLISSFQHLSQVRLKSKASLVSAQAVDALAWLVSHNKLYERVCEAENEGYTVNMEWVGPNNRIVIGYLEPKLQVLNARRRADGSYMPRDSLVALMGEENVIQRVDIPNGKQAEFVESIHSMTGVEGFVLTLDGGMRVKCKCDWYLALHHTKDSINNPRRLFEAILDEAVDDLRAMFYDDPLAIHTIDTMQEKVDTLFNHTVQQVETFYEQHKHLDRKTYAITATKQFAGNWVFGMVMSKYLGKCVDYKSVFKNKWKELGFKDTTNITEV